MYFKIINQDTNTVLFSRARKANTFFKRLFGLMFKKNISEQEALVFYNAPSIHTFFMRFAIDIIFLDNDMRIIRICEGLKPFRVVFCKGVFCTIECLSGTVSVNKAKEGNVIKIEKANL